MNMLKYLVNVIVSSLVLFWFQLLHPLTAFQLINFYIVVVFESCKRENVSFKRLASKQVKV